MQENAPEVAAYFDALFQSQLHSPPIRCGFAGEAKGKAIFAGRALKAGEPIWTEAPFVAMQHEDNKEFVDCCDHCFVPLIDSKETWARVLASNAEAGDAPSPDDEVGVAAPEDLEAALAFLQREGGKAPEDSYFAVFRLSDKKVQCNAGCGALYCSDGCRQLAYAAHHALLCPGEAAKADDSAFGHFLNHTLVTNEIFQLAAKVVAKILLRFVATQDLAQARQPVDMFCKLPWWEVITSEEDVDGEESMTLEEYRGKFRALLGQTFELFVPGLRENLDRLADRGELNGLTTDGVLAACESVVNVDFFSQIVGMFEMNNISMEIDHPFHALGEALSEADAEGKKEMPQSLARVKAALEKFVSDHHSQHVHDDGDEAHEHTEEEEDECDCMLEDFVGVEGTALFSGICTMNHSCDPNCTVLYTKDGAAHVFAVQDIAVRRMDLRSGCTFWPTNVVLLDLQEGDELCISYIDVDQEVNERNECLQYVSGSKVETGRRACRLTRGFAATGSTSSRAIARGARRSARRDALAASHFPHLKSPFAPPLSIVRARDLCSSVGVQLVPSRPSALRVVVVWLGPRERALRGA